MLINKINIHIGVRELIYTKTNEVLGPDITIAIVKIKSLTDKIDNLIQMELLNKQWI